MTLHPLAADIEPDVVVKIIFFGIVGVAWLVGALGKAIQKANTPPKKPPTYAPLPPDVMQAPPPIPRRNKPAKQKKFTVTPPAQRKAPSPPAPRGPSTLLSQAPLAQPVAASQKPATSQVEPSKIARLVRRPDSLRAALILNEVLSPPLALRDHPATQNGPNHQ